MNVIPTRDEIRRLSEERDQLCVSIYMPTFRKGEDSLQNPVRLRNLLREAASQLEAKGLRATEIEKFLERAHRLAKDYDFSQQQSDGLAVFFTSDIFEHYQIPIPFDEAVVVNSRFYMQPLLQVFSSDSHFFLLTLSQQLVKLYHGSRFGLEEVVLKNVPHSLAESLKYEETERAHHFSASSQGRKAGSAPVFHGHGLDATDKEKQKQSIARFCQMVNKGVHDALRNENAPLVIAALDYMHPLYREGNAYPHLLEEGITTNPEDLRPEELHPLAWQIVEPFFRQNQQDAIERFNELAGTGRASIDLGEVVPAAADGRIDTLLISAGLQRWGVFEPATRRVELRNDKNGESEDLIDLAAVRTFLNGGRVFAVEQEKIPARSPVAAVFRY